MTVQHTTQLIAPLNEHADVNVPSLVKWQRDNSACCSGTNHQRRKFSAAVLGLPFYAGLTACTATTPNQAQAQVPQQPTQEGVRVGRNSTFANLVSAEEVEAASAKQFAELKADASRQNALAPANHPQMQRLRYIAERIIPRGTPWNPRAQQWRWEVILVGSPELNAFCMPGGKICFYHGILSKLKLSDSEVAMIMGHEMAHALRDHAREQMGKQAATSTGLNVLSQVLGLGSTANQLLGLGGQLLSLRFSRDDEKDADLVGLELATRAGYDPSASVSLWQKMMQAGAGSGISFLSTHPSGPERIRDLQNALPAVQALYAQAEKPKRNFPIATSQ